MAARKKPLDHLRSRKKPIYFDFPIAEDATYRDKVQEAATKVAQVQLRAGRNRSGVMPAEVQYDLDEAEEQLDRAQKELEPHQIWFRARSLPPKEYDKLVSDHPPTEEQRKDAKKLGVMALAYNYETFLPELAIRCVYYLYIEDEDGEIAGATPPFDDKKRKEAGLPPLQEELVSKAFFEEMKEDGHWAAGEIQTICQAASNVNQGIRKLTELGNV